MSDSLIKYKQQQYKAKMKLKIKDLKGQQFTIDVDPSDCILDIKNAIKGEKNLPTNVQKLIFKGKALDDGIILTDIGVKDGDSMVLMKIIVKKVQEVKDTKVVDEGKSREKKASVSQKKQEKGETKTDNKNAQKLVKLGYTQKQAEQALQKHDNNFQKAIDDLVAKHKAQGKQIPISEELRQQMMRSLVANQQLLSMNENGQIKFTGDLASLAGLLGDKNEELQKMLLENPDALNQLLLNEEGDMQGLEEEQDEAENQFVQDVVFTEQEEQAIQRLMALGFTRENVIPAYLSCEKNEQLAANMLFQQQENGDFDDNQ